MRAVLSGVYLKNLLSWKTYVAKFFGLICMLCSGLSLGMLGPVVHLVSCLSANLPYAQISKNNTLRHQIFTAAIAVGVTATFGAPIGGVLFSIELTTNFYNIFNLWKSLFAATIAVIIFKSFRVLGFVELFDASGHHFYKSSYNIGLNHELPFFMIMAVFMGFLGSFYIFIHRVFCQMKRKYQHIWFFNPWFYTLFIAAIITNVEYFSKVTQFPDREVIKSMVDIDWVLASSNQTV